MRRLPLAFALALILSPLAGSAQDLQDEPRDLTFVGFQQYNEASRVFVRTNEAVKFRVDTSKDDLVVLVLENTGVSKSNNLRHLDTRFFKSPVAFIQPRLIEGPSNSVHIEIRLRQKVPFKQVQNDNLLALDFQMP